MKVPVTEVKLSVFKSRYLWYRQTTTFYSLAYFLSPLPASKYLLKPHFPESIIRMPLFQIRPEVEWTHSDLVSSATVLSFYCSPGPGQHLHCQPQPPMPPPLPPPGTRAVSRGCRIGPDTTVCMFTYRTFLSR